MEILSAENKTYVVGGLGTGAGIFTGEFVTESITRATGATGDWKLGAKIAGKVLLGALAKYASNKTLGLGSYFFDTFALGCWGSVVIDLVNRIYPGGATAAAVATASALRGVRTTAGVVTTRIERLEAAPVAGESHLVG